MPVPRRSLAVLLGTVVALGFLVAPVHAAPPPPETALAERTNPAVQVITTEYTGKVSIKRDINFNANGEALIVRAAGKLQRREIRSEASFISYIFDRVQRDPAYYLKATGRTISRSFKVQYVGSGFIATPDGYVVTARHVVTPDSSVRSTFAKAGAASFGDELARDVQQDFAEYDLSSGALRSIARSVQGAVAKNVQVDVSKPKVAVRLGVTDASGNRTGKNQPAQVVYRSDEDLGEDVAVLRIRVDSQLPSLTLAAGPPLQGSQVYINAFPAAATYQKNFSKAAQLQPTLTQGNVTSVRTTKGGLSIYQTDANASGGSSGGATLNEAGEVIGILVSGAANNGVPTGDNYVMPLDSVRDGLTRSGANLVPSRTQQLWDAALTDYHNEYYSRALPEFQQVRDLFPGHAYVGRYISDAQSAIDRGLDRTPPPPSTPGWVAPVVIGVSLLALAALAVGLVLLLRRRRVAAVRASQGLPGQPAGQLPPGAWSYGAQQPGPPWPGQPGGGQPGGGQPGGGQPGGGQPWSGQPGQPGQWSGPPPGWSPQPPGSQASWGPGPIPGSPGPYPQQPNLPPGYPTGGSPEGAGGAHPWSPGPGQDDRPTSG